MDAQISFSALYETDFNITDLFAMRQNWRNNEQFAMSSPRNTCALLYFEKGGAVCAAASGSKLTFPHGSLALLPAGSQYCWYFGSKEDLDTVSFLFEFLPCSHTGVPLSLHTEVMCLDTSHGGYFKPLFEELAEQFARPQPDLCTVKSLAYRLLAEVCRISRKKTLSAEKAGMIMPGIRYLEENPEQSLTVAELAKLCNVSTNYFTRLFFLYAGQTPCAYRLDKKLARAAHLLKFNGMSIDEVAERSGFCDGAYLCRVFRKKYGMSPAKYRELG